MLYVTTTYSYTEGLISERVRIFPADQEPFRLNPPFKKPRRLNPPFTSRRQNGKRGTFSADQIKSEDCFPPIKPHNGAHDPAFELFGRRRTIHFSYLIGAKYPNFGGVT
eukprot:5094436-Pleurochrysis_carterae.AAC.1